MVLRSPKARVKSTFFFSFVPTASVSRRHRFVGKLLLVVEALTTTTTTTTKCVRATYLDPHPPAAPDALAARWTSSRETFARRLAGGLPDPPPAAEEAAAAAAGAAAATRAAPCAAAMSTDAAGRPWLAAASSSSRLRSTCSRKALARTFTMAASASEIAGTAAAAASAACAAPEALLGGLGGEKASLTLCLYRAGRRPKGGQCGYVNMYQLNDFWIKPWSRGSGRGVALLMHPEGVQAEVMCSHGESSLPC